MQPLKLVNVVSAGLLVAVLASPGAIAQTGGGANGNPAAANGGAGNHSAPAGAPGNHAAAKAPAGSSIGTEALPSQRIVQNRAAGLGALVTVSPAGVREVQQRLNQLGYFAGPVNGIWDRATAGAMLAFQQAHGLEPTGNLNFSSIAGLGLFNRLIANPNGNNNRSLAGLNTTGAPPPRGKTTTRFGSGMPPAK